MAMPYDALSPACPREDERPNSQQLLLECVGFLLRRLWDSEDPRLELKQMVVASLG